MTMMSVKRDERWPCFSECEGECSTVDDDVILIVSTMASTLVKGKIPSSHDCILSFHHFITEIQHIQSSP